jgi:hypothetical protein
MRRAVLILTVTAAAMLWASTALAQTVPQGNLDANCQADPTRVSLFNRDQRAAQTFTPLNSGKLTSAQVLVSHGPSDGPGDYVLKIATVDTSGVPTTNVPASATIPKSSIPFGEQTITANFPADSAAQVVAGQTYALIVQRGNNDTLLAMPERADNPCSGGSVYWSTAGGPFWQIDGSRDFIFATYVTPPPDAQAPRVTRDFKPTGTGVARDINVIAAFSEEMNRNTLTETTFKLFKVVRNADGSTTLQRITNVRVTPSGDGFSAKRDPYPSQPSKLLAANTRYRAVVTPGAEDVAGNGLDQDPSKEGNQRKVWSFTTGGSL